LKQHITIDQAEVSGIVVQCFAPNSEADIAQRWWCTAAAEAAQAARRCWWVISTYLTTPALPFSNPTVACLTLQSSNANQ